MAFLAPKLGKTFWLKPSSILEVSFEIHITMSYLWGTGLKSACIKSDTQDVKGIQHFLESNIFIRVFDIPQFSIPCGRGRSVKQWLTPKSNFPPPVCTSAHHSNVRRKQRADCVCTVCGNTGFPNGSRGGQRVYHLRKVDSVGAGGRNLSVVTRKNKTLFEECKITHMV